VPKKDPAEAFTTSQPAKKWSTYRTGQVAKQAGIETRSIGPFLASESTSRVAEGRFELNLFSECPLYSILCCVVSVGSVTCFLNAARASPLENAGLIQRQSVGITAACTDFPQSPDVKSRLILILEVRKLASLQAADLFRKSGGPCAHSPDELRPFVRAGLRLIDRDSCAYSPDAIHNAAFTPVRPSHRMVRRLVRWARSQEFQVQPFRQILV
jgi:hypothetical protein